MNVGSEGAVVATNTNRANPWNWAIFIGVGLVFMFLSLLISWLLFGGYSDAFLSRGTGNVTGNVAASGLGGGSELIVLRQKIQELQAQADALDQRARAELAEQQAEQVRAARLTQSASQPPDQNQAQDIKRLENQLRIAEEEIAKINARLLAQPSRESAVAETAKHESDFSETALSPGSVKRGSVGDAKTYVVADGDNLSKVSKQLCQSIPELQKLNPSLLNVNSLRIGQKIQYYDHGGNCLNSDRKGAVGLGAGIEASKARSSAE